MITSYSSIPFFTNFLTSSSILDKKHVYKASKQSSLINYNPLSSKPKDFMKKKAQPFKSFIASKKRNRIIEQPSILPPRKKSKIELSVSRRIDNRLYICINIAQGSGILIQPLPSYTHLSDNLTIDFASNAYIVINDFMFF